MVAMLEGGIQVTSHSPLISRDTPQKTLNHHLNIFHYTKEDELWMKK